MSTLEYVNFTDPPQFSSTGDPYFPAGLYTGTFPLHWNDLYENTLNGKRVMVGFSSCTEGKYSCHITVETTDLKLDLVTESMD